MLRKKLLDEYTNIISAKYLPNFSECKITQNKIFKEDTYIPKWNEYKMLLKNNYSVQHLKLFATYYKLKTTGTKTQLLSRLYSYLYLSWCILKIQKIFRGHMQRRFILLRGPALYKRDICTNNFDFLTMELIKDISENQFFSYQDNDGFIYGFDLLSIYNLMKKNNDRIKNPFNNQAISDKIVCKIKSLLKISKILDIPICTEITDVNNNVSESKSIELKALALFQFIDSLGNYSNPQWFMSLNLQRLHRFIKELIEIWTYRAVITPEVKRAICPPMGNPFNYLINLERNQDICLARKCALDIIEKMVTRAEHKDNKCLGAFYVLGALTLVSSDAANALPWLFQAVCYM